VSMRYGEPPASDTTSSMARIVLGHRDGALATRQARTVLSELSAEWPDVQVVLRHIPANGSADPLLAALAGGALAMAVVAVDTLPATLPAGLSLTAVGRRAEPRMALVTKGRALADLPPSARVRVHAQRDLGFLRAVLPGADAEVWHGTVDDALARLVAGEHDALLLPGALLIAVDQRDRIDELLDAETFPPAPGLGAMGLLVRSDDDAAAELAYTFQHRASFDRVRAERAFAAGLADFAVGALATIDDDGDLELFGAVVTAGGTTLHATTSGDPKDAEELGSELAKDVREQLAALA
jgi:hydroxymethylbilane synthase